MEELEDSTEHLHEKIHEEAHEAEHNKKEKWILWVALFTALVSVLAASPVCFQPIMKMNLFLHE